VTEALLRFFAPCPRGLEQVLADELKGLGASNVRIRAAGVQFEADRAGGYRANLHSRLASRVLFWLGSGQVRQDEDVYRIARRQDWTKLFTVEQRLRVDLSATRSRARSLQYLTLRIKDAVVDGFREHSEQRPSVDTQDPDVRIVGHLEADRLDLYMDWSGESLFKRGWRGRDDKGEAPLKENLAAGLVHLSQWSSDQPLADLFCGSGTILIEAAQIRWGIAPGLKRRFAFEALKDFDPLLWLSVRDDAIAQAKACAYRALELRPLLGVDINPELIDRARHNALQAGLPPGAIQWRCDDAFTVNCQALADDPDPPTANAKALTSDEACARQDTAGFIISDLPYGERIGLCGDFEQGRSFRDRWPGFMLCILSAQEDLPSLWRMKAKRKVPLMNASIPCRFFSFPLHERHKFRAASGRSEDCALAQADARVQAQELAQADARVQAEALAQALDAGR